jgi:hypothetical protein
MRADSYGEGAETCVFTLEFATQTPILRPTALPWAYKKQSIQSGNPDLNRRPQVPQFHKAQYLLLRIIENHLVLSSGILRDPAQAAARQSIRRFPWSCGGEAQEYFSKYRWGQLSMILIKRV